MLTAEYKKANVGAGVWLLSMVLLLASIFTINTGENIWDGDNNIVAGIFIIQIASMFYALWFYSKAKGYSGYIGILLSLLHLLGWVILLMLKDKTIDHEETDPNYLANQQALKKQQKSGWILLALSTLSIWASSDYAESRFAISLGEVVGQSLVGSLLLIILVALVPSWRKGISMTLLVGTVFTLSGGYKSFSLLQEGQDLRLMVNSLSGAIDDINSGKVVKKLDSDSPKYLQVMNNYMAAEQGFSMSLIEKINEANIESILSPDKLVNVASVRSSRETLRNLLIDINFYEKERLSLIDKTAEQLLALNTKESREAHGGFAGTIPKRKSIIKQYHEIQRGSVNLVIGIMDFAESRKGTFSVDNGQLLFSTNEDVSLYNALIDKLVEVGEQESKLIEQVRIDQNKNRDKLKELIN